MPNTQADVHRRIFESATDPIVVVGTDGAFLDANRAARETGLIEDAVRQVALRKPATEDIRLVDRTGALRVFVPSEQRVGSTYVLTYRDVTALRAVEDALAQSRRIESLGYVTVGAVHDFNNLLTPILCSSSLLAADATETTRTGALALEIRGAAERAAELVRQLMSFARRKPSIVQRVDVNAALLALRPLIVRALPENVAFELALSGGPLDVKLDKSRLETAILNLVVNARDAMPRGGKIVVRTSVEPSPTGGLAACITVSDDGDGMSPEVHARVFDRFFTTKAPGQGTGLGLPAVQSFVVAAGGHLTIQSELERGTVVRVFLPREQAAVDTVPVPSRDRGKLPGGTEKIVVVEDDESVRRTLRVVLEEEGYRVVEAPAKSAALDVVRGGDVDLVIVDRVLRGSSGSTLARSLVTASPETRVLVISGHLGELLQTDEPNDLPFLQKPIDRGELLRMVRSVLDGRAAAPSATVTPLTQ